ncbi:MAG: NfeD family protein [Clostridia bacterium]|nr:NfeD family protein [Clostridia bacterium]MDD4686176.1 NfeD family protein [Clostridia bacterium]
MIFASLTIFQNIIFIIATLSIVILIVYIILPLLDIKQKEVVSSDDIDSETEPYENIYGFVKNAFKIKGSIFFLVFASCLCFLFSFFIDNWISIILGLIFGCAAAIIVGLLDRKPIGEIGDFAIASSKIPEKDCGMGKVILLENNSEVNAESVGKAIKKGKKVIVVERFSNKVIVKKLKRKNKQ